MLNKKVIRTGLLIALVLAIVVSIGATFAYFSDRATTTKNGLGGEVEISMDGSGIAFGDTVESAATVKVGSATDFAFTITNEKDASVIVSPVITMNLSRELEIETIPTDFEIYNKSDITVIDGVYTINNGAKPVGTRVVAEDGKSITYTLDNLVLSGDDYYKDDQKEYINTDGDIIHGYEYEKLSDVEKANYTIMPYTKTYELVFIFNTNSQIEATDIEFVVSAEAAQYRSAKAWTDEEVIHKYGKSEPAKTAQPSVSITKTANKTTFYPGETIRYTITVTNTGNVSLKDVVITEYLEGGYFLEQEGVTINGLVATIAEIQVNETIELTFLFDIPEGYTPTQPTTGNLLITVLRTGGAEDVRLADVPVTITNGTDTYEKTTSASGTILLEDLAPGSYSITLSDGAEAYSGTVTIEEGKSTKFNVKLGS